MFDFHIPLLDRPILWYGFFFATGFFAAYWVLLWMLKKKMGSVHAKKVAERLTFYVIVGTVVGARLGDLIFYQEWGPILRDPTLIFRVWEGGLASHGGAAGILIALYIFSRREKTLSWLELVDHIALPAGLVCGFIRIGNFVNQELLGKVTTVPWAVVFGHPADGSLPVPRHPVQLYESIGYFVLFFVTLTLWRKFPKIRAPGRVSGLFLILVFLFRFFIEFFKEEASLQISEGSFFDMAQFLSLPFILFGVFLLVRKEKKVIR